MAKTKKILSRGVLSTIALLWCVRWAKVTFQPLYSDIRFQPSDKLHAWCSNSADILFSPQGQKITKFKLVLYYHPENLEILRILPTINDGSATSKIEYNKILLEVTNPKFESSTANKSFFQIYFKSTTAGKDTIILGTWSEVVTPTKTYPLEEIFELNFAKVPECEPDIIPPSINLIYPKDSEQRIPLDQYFIFDIKDIGKGVDKTSVMINFQGDQYFYGSENIKRNGNYLTFYPNKRLPIDTDIDLSIMISDQQSYGGANKTQSKYTFISATWMLLTKQITPIIFRRIAQEAEKISASVDECDLLTDLYIKSDVTYQWELRSIMQKVGCDISVLTTTINEKVIEKDTTPQQSQYRNISVFATIGWILFFITFTLKLHYLTSYRKHKKINSEKRIQKQ